MSFAEDAGEVEVFTTATVSSNEPPIGRWAPALRFFDQPVHCRQHKIAFYGVTELVLCRQKSRPSEYDRACVIIEHWMATGMDDAARMRDPVRTHVDLNPDIAFPAVLQRFCGIILHREQASDVLSTV